MAFTWTEDNVKLLKELLHQGYSSREIGEKLGGISRNSVIGKAHRLGLSAPKKDSDHPTSSGSGRKKGHDVVKISSTLHKSTDKLCQWPIGEPGTADFRFCHEKAESGRPYCEEHCIIAYRTAQ